VNGMTNAVNFFEVTGRDGAKLRRFYGELFGWEFRDSGDPNYGLVRAKAGAIGGGIGNSWDGGPGQTLFYIEVEDIGRALEKAECLGGKRIGQPLNVSGALTIALMADPEDHIVGLSMSHARR
jgi:uncharacterized protein